MIRVLQQRHLKSALAASLLLHAGLLAGLFHVQMAKKNAANTESKPALLVGFAGINPQRGSRRSTTSVSGEDDTTLSSPPNTPALVATQPLTPVAPSSAVDAGTNESAGIEQSSDATDGEPVALDASALQQSITNYVTSQHGVRQQQWLTECQRYRNRYEKQDCPPGEEAKSEQREAIDNNLDDTFMAWVNGHDRNKRMADELVKEGEELHALMEQGGLIGQLAGEQYAVKQIFFNKVLSPETEAQRTSREHGIRILTFPSKNGLVFFGGLFTIGFNGKVKVNDKQAKGPALLIKEAEFKEHSEPENAEPTFQVVSPIFDSAND